MYQVEHNLSEMCFFAIEDNNAIYEMAFHKWHFINTNYTELFNVSNIK